MLPIINILILVQLPLIAQKTLVHRLVKILIIKVRYMKLVIRGISNFPLKDGEFPRSLMNYHMY
jgi:hypothetical protein